MVDPAMVALARAEITLEIMFRAGDCPACGSNPATRCREDCGPAVAQVALIRTLEAAGWCTGDTEPCTAAGRACAHGWHAPYCHVALAKARLPMPRVRQ